MAGAIQTILNFREDMTAGLRRIRGATEDNQSEIDLLNNRVSGFKESATSGFNSVAKSVAGLAVGFLGIGAAFITVDSSIDSIKEYSESLAQLSAATGKSGKQFDNMKESMVAIYGQNFGESWTDVGDSLTTVTQITGQTGKALEESTKNALTYRDVFKAELPDSIKATDNMMRQFGINSTKAYNLLIQGSQSGLDKSGELLEGVSEFGVHFKQLGFTADEMFNALGSGMDSGAFSMATLGDAVKEFGIITKEGGDGAKDTFKALGLDATKMTATFAKGGIQAKTAFDQVVKAIDKIKDPVKKNAAGVSLFGGTWEDLGAKSISALAKVKGTFDSSKNSMGDINKVKYTGIGSAMEGIKRTLETNILIPIADKILPKLSDFSNWINSKTPEIKAKIDDAFTTGKKILEGFKDSIGWVKDNAEWLIPVMIGLTAAIVAQNVIAGVTKLMKAYQAATTGMTIAQKLLNLTMAVSPFGWIALAIGAVVVAGYLLYKNWDTVKEKASQLWSWISGVWTNLKDGTVNVFNNVKDKVSGAFTSLVGIVKKPINSIIGLINGLIDKINSLSITFPSWMPGDLGGKTFGLNIPHIPEFALGTSYAKGGLSLVGERGPELVNLNKGDSVTTASNTKKVLSGNGNAPIQIIIQGNVYGEKDFIDKVGQGIQRLISLQMTNA